MWVQGDSRRRRSRLLPHVADTGWFFDTELLVLAERSGLRIHEVPVDWIDDPDSRVDIVATATADLKGVGRLLRGFASGSIPVNAIAAQLAPSRSAAAAPNSLFRQVVRFGAIGVASTAAYLLLFMVLHPVIGAQVANFVALLLTAIVNTAANRRFTFGVSGATKAARHHVEGLIVFGIALAITSGALAGLHAFVEAAAPPARGVRPGGGQPARHRRSIRPPARLGVSPPPNPLTPTESKDTTVTLTAEDVRPDAVAAEASPPDPRWTRPAFWALLVGTGVLYLWGLGSSGWGNSYYAAAAQSGTQDWRAWLFGSLDAGNAITVDKPPAAMWVMALSGRLFGFNEFTMLLPEALMGVGAVALLYLTVRRSSGPSAGLIAGLVLALTPVATLMFRFNNPDALLVLLLIVAAYCTVRAIDASTARRMTMWLALTGTAIGFAFLTKMLQAFLVLPGLALAVLVAAPFGVWKRLGALLVGGAAMIVSAGWYVALVSVWPTDSRPYIAGSTDNSLLQLAFGYNGIERIAGNEGGGPGGGGHHGRRRRQAVVLRR